MHHSTIVSLQIPWDPIFLDVTMGSGSTSGISNGTSYHGLGITSKRDCIYIKIYFFLDFAILKIMVVE